MKLRYFVVDQNNQLQRTSHEDVNALWEGRSQAKDLGGSAVHELRLVSVLCDKKLMPRKIYLLRLPLTEGKFTQESYLTLQVFTMPDCVTPREAFEHHAGGWPTDFRQQLAVALDVPVSRAKTRLRIGGPLMIAAAMRVTPRQALRYLQ